MQLKNNLSIAVSSCPLWGHEPKVTARPLWGHEPKVTARPLWGHEPKITIHQVCNGEYCSPLLTFSLVIK